jgi:hypothetical protein
MKPRLPSLLIQAERLHILKKAREIATDNSIEAGDLHKKVLDKKAKLHVLKEGDIAYLHNQLFLGENKIFS